MNEILDAIEGFLGQNKPDYVYCWGGVGRTGTVVGCWLLRHDRLAEPSNVLEVLRDLRRQDQERGHRESPETEEQRRFVLG
jgi:protein-tyrosine phosphatase